MSGSARATPPDLATNDTYRRLVRGLTLSDRFHFHLALCTIPRAAEQLVEQLGVDLPRERGKPVRFVRLDPYATHDFSKPLSEEDLFEAVLRPLAEPSEENRRHGVIHLLDASCARRAEDPAWTWVFHRMNERRNSITRGLGGELILLCPPHIELLFIHEAPDFWSVRSGEAFVESELGPETAPKTEPGFELFLDFVREVELGGEKPPTEPTASPPDADFQGSDVSRLPLAQRNEAAARLAFYSNRGDREFLTGWPPHALRSYEEGIRYAIDAESARGDMGLSDDRDHVAVGRQWWVIRSFRRHCLLMRAVVASELKRTDGVLENLTRAVELTEDSTSHLALGLYFLGVNEPEQALREIRTAISILERDLENSHAVQPGEIVAERATIASLAYAAQGALDAGAPHLALDALRIGHREMESLRRSMGWSMWFASWSAFMHRTHGSAALTMENHQEGLSHLEAAVSMSQSTIGMSDDEKLSSPERAARALSNAYERTGDHRRAAYYRERASPSPDDESVARTTGAEPEPP